MTTLDIVRGSYGIDYVFTYLTSAGTPRDLSSGAAVYLTVWLPGNPELVLLHKATTVDPGTGGTCHYVSQQNDFIMTGKFYAELQIDSSINDPSQMFVINVTEGA